MFDPKQTWSGVGLKTGGMIGPVGYESVSGRFFNAGDLSLTYDFQIKSARQGLGLGGGAGLVVYFVFKLNSFAWMHDRLIEDWGISVSLGENYWTILRYLSDRNFFAKVKLVSKTLNALATHGEEFRNVASFLYNVYDFDKNGDHPMVNFDVPGAGKGLEVAAFKTGGRLRIVGESVP